MISARHLATVRALGREREHWCVELRMCVRVGGTDLPVSRRIAVRPLWRAACLTMDVRRR